MIETAVTLFKDGWTTPDGWVSQYIGGPVQQSVELIKQGWTTIKQFVVNAGVDIVEQAIKLTQHGWTTVDKYTEDHQGTGTVDEGVTLSKDGWSTVEDFVVGEGLSVVTQSIELFKKGWQTVTGYTEENKGEGTVTEGVELETAFGGGIATVTGWLATQAGQDYYHKVLLGPAWGTSPKTTVSEWITNSGLVGAGVSTSVNLTKNLSGYSNFANWLTNSTDGSTKVKVNLVKGNKAEWTFSTPQGKTTISMYKNGGYVSTGQLFMAREAGPELVGSIGNRTAVANNDQIVQGIEGGVRTANEDVVAAIYTLIGAVENKDMSVNIGDREVYDANARYSRKRGAVVNRGAFANTY